jgi:hypothetical protein
MLAVQLVRQNGMQTAKAQHNATTDTAFKLLGGLDLYPNIAVEASYFSLGKATAMSAVSKVNSKQAALTSLAYSKLHQSMVSLASLNWALATSKAKSMRLTAH